MKPYTRKIAAQAIQATPENLTEIKNHFPDAELIEDGNPRIVFNTFLGELATRKVVFLGNYIVKEDDVLTLLSDDAFEAIYSPIKE